MGRASDGAFKTDKQASKLTMRRYIDKDKNQQGTLRHYIVGCLVLLRTFGLKYQSLKMSSLENPFLTLIISHGRYSAIVSPTRGASFEASAMMRTAFTILLYLRSWCFYNNQFQCSIIQILNIHFCIDRYF